MAAAAPRRRMLPPPLLPREATAARLLLLVGAELVLALEAAAVVEARCCRGLVALPMRWHCVRVCISETYRHMTNTGHTHGTHDTQIERKRDGRPSGRVG